MYALCLLLVYKHSYACMSPTSSTCSTRIHMTPPCIHIHPPASLTSDSRTTGTHPTHLPTAFVYIQAPTCVVDTKQSHHRHLLRPAGPHIVSRPLQAVVNLQLLKHCSCGCMKGGTGRVTTGLQKEVTGGVCMGCDGGAHGIPGSNPAPTAERMFTKVAGGLKRMLQHTNNTH